MEEVFKELTIEKDNGKINVFVAAGLTNQEVKHSAFLGWLLDRSKPHNLQNAFLKKLLEELFPHANAVALKPDQKTNLQILQAAGMYSAEDLRNFIDSDYRVFTELSTFDNTGRMDIVVESEQTETVLVIENKTFTTTHDCQLSKYEEHYRNSNFKRKIFVFLTVNNDLPIDIDDDKHQYRPDWCVFDYGTIVKIVKSLIPKATNETNKKLKMIMEDYIDMVNTHLLRKNKEIREKCKEIRKRYPEAVDLLINYTDNVETVYRYISEVWLPRNIHNCSYVAPSRRSVYFTETIKNYYLRHGLNMETADGAFKFQISVFSKNGPITMDMWLSKDENEDWSEADIKIHDFLQPNKKMGKKFCTVYSCLILSEEERGEPFEDDAELFALINDRLRPFLDKFNALENQLLKM